MPPSDSSHWTRRAFIAAGVTAAGAAAAGYALRGRFVRALEEAAPLPDLSTWNAVRSQFKLHPGFAHFASFLLASHPHPVEKSIHAFRDALDRRPVRTLRNGLRGEDYERLPLLVRLDMAEYLGVQPDEIALTPNTTTGLALIYHGLPLKAGDEVLTTTHDHYSHHESIRLATERCGATMRKVALYDHGAEASVPQILERLRGAIRENTRAVGVTWVHSSTGVRLPIRDIAAVVAEANRGRSDDDRACLIVDGVHGLGVVDETVGEMGCDFFSAGTHKWMFGPRGTGLLWGRAEEWPRMRPTIPTFSSADAHAAWRDERPPGPTTAAHVTPGGYLPFEHQWAVGTAFRMHRAMGRARVAERIRTLNDQCKAGLAQIKNVRLHTPLDPALSAGLIAFEVGARPVHEVVTHLRLRNIIASASPYKASYPRLAPSLVNTEQEVETVLREVEALAKS